MAGNLSDYLEDKLLDHFLGTNTYTAPTDVYVALYTVAPTDAGGGTEVTNTGGSTYARQLVTFDVASGGATSNDTDIDFEDMPSATVVAIGIHDAVTSGNLLVYGDLTANKALDAGDILRIATGDLDISID
jgi:hypothetical protein